MAQKVKSISIGSPRNVKSSLENLINEGKRIIAFSVVKQPSTGNATVKGYDLVVVYEE